MENKKHLIIVVIILFFLLSFRLWALKNESKVASPPSYFAKTMSFEDLADIFA